MQHCCAQQYANMFHVVACSLFCVSRFCWVRLHATSSNAGVTMLHARCCVRLLVTTNKVARCCADVAIVFPRHKKYGVVLKNDKILGRLCYPTDLYKPCGPPWAVIVYDHKKLHENNLFLIVSKLYMFLFTIPILHILFTNHIIIYIF